MGQRIYGRSMGKVRARWLEILFWIVLLVSIVLCVPSYSAPSKRMPAPWLIGVRAGLSFSYSRTNPSESGSTRQGILIGVFSEKRIGPSFYLQPEFYYYQKGVTTTLGEFAGAGVGGTVKLDSVDMPLWFKYKHRLRRMAFYAMAAPFFSIHLRRDFEVISLATLSLRNRFRWYDFGIGAGVGMETVLSPNFRGMVGLRFLMGLADLDRSASSYRSRAIQITASLVTRLE